MSRRTTLLFLMSAGLGATAVGMALSAVAIRNTSSDPPPPLAVYETLPAFERVDREGEPYGAEQLDGKVWIANFIFTRCQGPCPMMLARTRQLQDILEDHPRWDRIRLVSFSVDPEHDTPPVLAGRAESLGADPVHWRFLTGEREALWRMIRDRFKLHVQQTPENEAMPITHSTKFVLIDGSRRVRGYYDALSDSGRDRLLADVDRLLAEQR